MAISFIGMASSSSNNPLTGSFMVTPSAQAGDLAIAVWYTRASTKSFTKPTNVTQLQDVSTANGGHIFIGWWQVSSSSDSQSWSSGSVSNATAGWFTSVFREVSMSAPFHTTSGSPTNGTATQDPDPPSVTPSASGTCGFCCYGQMDDQNGTYTVPSGYTDAGNWTSTSGTDASSGGAYKLNLTASSAENPGTFDTASGSNYWYTWTCALSPSQIVSLTGGGIASSSAFGSVTTGYYTMAGIASAAAFGTNTKPVNIWYERRPSGVDSAYNWMAVGLSGTGSMVYAGVYSGRLYLSSNSGASWGEKQPAGAIDANWCSVAISSNGAHQLMDRAGTAVYASTSSGSSYYSYATHTGSIYHIAMSQGNQYSLFTMDSAHIRAVNAGRAYYGSLYGSVALNEVRPTGENVNKNWMAATVSSSGRQAVLGISTGRLYMTQDAGSSWPEIQPRGNVDSSWYSAAMNYDGSIIYACDTRIWKSNNSGSSWSELRPAGDANFQWQSCHTSETGRYVFVSAYGGRIWYSGDYGDTWSEQRPAGDVAANWYTAMSADGSTLAAAAYGGRLYTCSRVTNGERVVSPYGIVKPVITNTLNDRFGDVSVFPNNVSGNIYFDRKGPISPVSSDYYYQYGCISGDCSYAYVSSGESGYYNLYKTTNKGDSWSTTSPPCSTTYNDCVSCSEDGAVVISYDLFSTSYLVMSTDYGGSWSYLNPGSLGTNVSRGAAVVSGDGQVIITNSGSSYNTYYSTNQGGLFTASTGINAQVTKWAISYAGQYCLGWNSNTLYKSSNYGASFSTVSPTGGSVTGWYDVWVSRDGSTMLSSAYISAGSPKFQIWKSTNYGVNWSQVTTPISNSDSNGMWYLSASQDASTIFISSRYGSFVSSDSGSNWENVELQERFRLITSPAVSLNGNILFGSFAPTTTADTNGKGSVWFGFVRKTLVPAGPQSGELFGAVSQSSAGAAQTINLDSTHLGIPSAATFGSTLTPYARDFTMDDFDAGPSLFGVAVVAQNNLLLDVDRWRSIQPAGSSNQYWLYSAMDGSGEVLIVAGYTFYTRLSTDGGDSWTALDIYGLGGESYYTRALAVSANGTGILAGRYTTTGRLYYSSDTGDSWDEVEPFSDNYWQSAATGGSGVYWLAGSTSRLYLSSNSCSNFSEAQPAGDADRNWRCTSVSKTNGSVMIAGSNSGSSGMGRLYRSTNYGSSWSETRPAGDADKYWQCADMSADGSVILAGATYGTGGAYLSTDSGQTWSEVTSPYTNTSCNNSIYAVGVSDNGQRMFIAGGWTSDVTSSEHIVTTVDGGTTWRHEYPAGQLASDATWCNGGVYSGLDCRTGSMNSDGSVIMLGVYQESEESAKYLWLGNLSCDRAIIPCGPHSSETFGSLDLSRYLVTPAGSASTCTFGTPLIHVVVPVSGIPSDCFVNDAFISALELEGIPSGCAFGTPNIAFRQLAIPAGIAPPSPQIGTALCKHVQYVQTSGFYHLTEYNNVLETQYSEYDLEHSVTSFEYGNASAGYKGHIFYGSDTTNTTGDSMTVGQSGANGSRSCSCALIRFPVPTGKPDSYCYVQSAVLSLKGYSDSSTTDFVIQAWAGNNYVTSYGVYSWVEPGHTDSSVFSLSATYDTSLGWSTSTSAYNVFTSNTKFRSMIGKASDGKTYVYLCSQNMHRSIPPQGASPPSEMVDVRSLESNSTSARLQIYWSYKYVNDATVRQSSPKAVAGIASSATFGTMSRRLPPVYGISSSETFGSLIVRPQPTGIGSAWGAGLPIVWAAGKTYVSVVGFVRAETFGAPRARTLVVHPSDGSVTSVATQLDAYMTMTNATTIDGEDPWECVRTDDDWGHEISDNSYEIDTYSSATTGWYLRVGSKKNSSTNFTCYEAGLRFDDFELPSNWTTGEATLTLIVANDYSDTDFSVCVVKQSWGEDFNYHDRPFSNTVLGSSSTSGMSIARISIPWSDIVASQYYPVPRFVLRSYNTINAGHPPTGNEYIEFWSAGFPALAPTLTAEYRNGIVSSAAFGRPLVTNSIAVVGIPSGEVFGYAESNNKTRFMEAIPSGEAFGTISYSLVRAMAGVDSACAFGTIHLGGELGFVDLVELGVPSAAAFGMVVIGLGFPMTGVDSGSEFGEPVIVQVVHVESIGFIETEFGEEPNFFAWTSVLGIESAESFGPNIVFTMTFFGETLGSEGCIYGYDGDYEAAASAGDTSLVHFSGEGRVGQLLLNDVYYVFQTFWEFSNDLPTGASIVSATLNGYLGDDESDTDFILEAYLVPWPVSFIGTGEFSDAPVATRHTALLPFAGSRFNFSSSADFAKLLESSGWRFAVTSSRQRLLEEPTGEEYVDLGLALSTLSRAPRLTVSFLSNGYQVIPVGGITAQDEFGNIQQVWPFVSGLYGVESEAAFGGVVINTSAVAYGIASQLAFGTAVATFTTPQTVAAEGFRQWEVFGTTRVAGVQMVAASGLASEAAFGTTTRTQYAPTYTAPGIPSDAAFGYPYVIGGDEPEDDIVDRGYADNYIVNPQFRGTVRDPYNSSRTYQLLRDPHFDRPMGETWAVSEAYNCTVTIIPASECPVRPPEGEDFVMKLHFGDTPSNNRTFIVPNPVLTQWELALGMGLESTLWQYRDYPDDETYCCDVAVTAWSEPMDMMMQQLSFTESRLLGMQGAGEFSKGWGFQVYRNSPYLDYGDPGYAYQDYDLYQTPAGFQWIEKSQTWYAAIAAVCERPNTDIYVSCPAIWTLSNQQIIQDVSMDNDFAYIFDGNDDGCGWLDGPENAYKTVSYRDIYVPRPTRKLIVPDGGTQWVDLNDSTLAQESATYELRNLDVSWALEKVLVNPEQKTEAAIPFPTGVSAALCLTFPNQESCYTFSMTDIGLSPDVDFKNSQAYTLSVYVHAEGVPTSELEWYITLRCKHKASGTYAGQSVKVNLSNTVAHWRRAQITIDTPPDDDWEFQWVAGPILDGVTIPPFGEDNDTDHLKVFVAGPMLEEVDWGEDRIYARSGYFEPVSTGLGLMYSHYDAGYHWTAINYAIRAGRYRDGYTTGMGWRSADDNSSSYPLLDTTVSYADDTSVDEYPTYDLNGWVVLEGSDFGVPKRTIPVATSVDGFLDIQGPTAVGELREMNLKIRIRGSSFTNLQERIGAFQQMIAQDRWRFFLKRHPQATNSDMYQVVRCSPFKVPHTHVAMTHFVVESELKLWVNPNTLLH